MSCSQGNHNVAVGRPSHAAVAVAQVNAGNGEADVVNDASEFPDRNLTPNFALDTIDEDGGFLDPCSAVRAHM